MQTSMLWESLPACSTEHEFLFTIGKEEECFDGGKNLSARFHLQIFAHRLQRLLSEAVPFFAIDHSVRDLSLSGKRLMIMKESSLEPDGSKAGPSTWESNER